MRALLTWLMVLGVFTGLSMRVVAFSHSHDPDHHHTSSDDSSCDGHDHHHGHDHDHELPGDDPSSEDCPSGDHHHHHACCLPVQLAVEVAQGCRVPMPGSLLLGMQSLRLIPPDGPSFDLDKPPLI